MDNNTLTVGLSVIFSVVLVGPFLNKWVESNLEIFLFVMGAMSATLSSAWSSEVIHEGLVAPINITLAVLGAGVLFHYVRWTLDRGMRRVLITVPLPVIVCAGIVILGLISSIISAIIAALLLVEFITVLPLHRHAEVNLTIIACFAIVLGAAFKPLIDAYLTKISSQALFWVNMVSAVLDNATLAAAEIGPSLSETQIKSALLGLLISGGMLIPGNIPNIIAAHALHIKST